MPFTPFHMGPGLALKSVGGRHFSLIAFGATQVVIDIEPGIGLLRGSSTLHGWTHTYVGATVIAAIVVLCCPIWSRILKGWNGQLREHRAHVLQSPEPIGWLPAVVGAFAGAYSHVALDSIMHLDMRPFAPLFDANGMLGAISVPALYWACVAAGVVGLAFWTAGRWRRGNGKQAVRCDS